MILRSVVFGSTTPNDVVLVVCTENSDSDVLVMQPADERMRYDTSVPLNRTRNWCILVQ